MKMAAHSAAVLQRAAVRVQAANTLALPLRLLLGIDKVWCPMLAEAPEYSKLPEIAATLPEAACKSAE